MAHLAPTVCGAAAQVVRSEIHDLGDGTYHLKYVPLAAGAKAQSVLRPRRSHTVAGLFGLQRPLTPRPRPHSRLLNSLVRAVRCTVTTLARYVLSAGEYHVSVTLGGLAIGASPFVVRVGAGPAASIVVEGVPRKAYRDEPVSFRAVVLDSLGNQTPVLPQDVCVRVRAPLNAPKVPEVALMPLGDGSFACSFVPTRLGRHTVSAAGGSGALSVSPAEQGCLVLLRPHAGSGDSLCG